MKTVASFPDGETLRLNEPVALETVPPHGPGDEFAEQTFEKPGQTVPGFFDEEDSTGLDTFELYKRSIGKYPVLRAEEEVELAKDIEAGLFAKHMLSVANPKQQENRTIPSISDEQTLASDGLMRHFAGSPKAVADLQELAQRGDAAFERFVNSNLKLVVRIVVDDYIQKGRHASVPKLDLIQAGNIGMMHAVEKFDYMQGNKFSTYARFWIKKEIGGLIVEAKREAHSRGTREDQVRADKVVRARLEIMKQSDHEPSSLELAQQTKLKQLHVDAVLATEKMSVSLDMPIDEDGSGLTLSELLETDDNIPVDQQAIFNIATEKIHTLLGVLSKREQQIVRLFYGFEGTPKTLSNFSEIGRIVGLSGWTVSEYHTRALAKLRDRGTVSEDVRELVG